MDKILSLPSDSDIEKVLKKEGKELPGFAQVMAKMLTVCNDPKASIEDVAKLVATDPGITAKVLGIVNSSFFSLRSRVSAISEAVLFLGIDEIKKICLGVTFFEKMVKSGQKKQFDRTFFWRHCLCVASLSQAIAKEIGYPSPEDAYTAGLLHDFGKIVLDRSGRVNYADFCKNAINCTGPLVEAERDILGIGHDDLGAYYGNRWGFSQKLCLTIQYHHRRFSHLDLCKEDMQFICIVCLADFLAWTQGMGSVDVICPLALQPEIEKRIQLDRINFEAVIQKMDEEIENTAEFYEFEFPSSNQYRASLLKANLKLSTINSGSFSSKEKEIHEKKRSVTASITAPHSSLEPQIILSATLKAICQDFGFDRVYILRASPPLRRLQVVKCLKQDRFSDQLASHYISMDNVDNGFLQCLRNKAPVVINGALPGENEVLERFSISQMLVVPFCSHDKVIGLLGMDHVESGKKIEPGLFSSIAIVANELGLALENASAYKKAKSASMHDGMTGLLNRMAVDELLKKAFLKAVKENIALCVAMIDVDHFKKFNDMFGHQEGDNVLKLIAKTLKKMSRPTDHVGRYGGEEFIVVLNDTGPAKAVVYAERIRKEIEHLGHLLSDRFQGLGLTVSIGISKFENDIKSHDTLVSKADKALYKAKETGRNRVVSG
ncbi:diguanylate cyclase [Desulfobacter hydrogenophilus]|uniref:diguanylate cyclase n=1 Tax=Desulfobacter hydrogenophilus TaxID=2291 RepID=A0A328FEC6_9BACT|nr:HDOD domain-containing protein [Desulfobacter hydrogenophilus]NDY71884.1 HDOD domain-containing protein [Desulfobacter hydrogenophilus]QBH11981.1 HDOD domain-containing protein [Desulfobacter hydrogenophilus]RAM02659.1 diguanylate cyclase [Desulfobacter hydrogenophilus]